MTLRNPLVTTGGLIKELPSGDLLPAGSLLEAFRAPVYFGNMDSAPLGWITSDGTNTNDPAASVPDLMQTFVNEDDTAKVQVAYLIDSRMALRYWLGGSWSSWTFIVPGLVIDSIADSDTTHAPSRNAVFDALALKADASAVTSALASKADSSAVTSALAAKADLASPALTGNPTAPNQTAGTNNTRIANTAYADAKVADAIADSVTAIAPSQNAVFDALALKAPSVLTGYTSGSGTVGATDTVLQAIQKLNGNDGLKAPLASPVFTGTVETPAIKITTGAATKKKFISDASGNGSWVDDVDGLQWWQTFTIHAVGLGQQQMGIWVPYDCYLTKIRYRCATAGSGGSPLIELRKNGITGSETVSGTSFAPATSPSWNTPTAPGISLTADDLLYAYQTAINTTTAGVQLKVECLLVRR